MQPHLAEFPPEVPWDNRCRGCFLLPTHCICAQIPRLECSPTLWIVRHVREHRKTTNTARLAKRCLVNCHLLTYGDKDLALDLRVLPQQAHLLFPEALDHSGKPDPAGPPVHDLSLGPPTTPCENLVILDGTWSQARRMSHRIAQVAHLPRLSFSQVAPRARLRRPPREGTMATLEAIGHAMWYLAGDAHGEALIQVFDSFVSAYARQCNRPPKVSPSSRS